MFPCLWKVDSALLSETRAFRLELSETPGAGFVEQSESLLEEGVTAFTRLASIDRLMATAQQQRLSDQDYVLLVTARDECHHNLLSLPTWENFDSSTTPMRQSSWLLYEICRTAAVIYSNSVIFPISPRFPWHVTLITRLRYLFGFLGDDQWLSGAAVWAMFVGSIAAYRTPCFAFFGDLLRSVIVRRGLSYDDVRQVLKKFVWSDSACELGTAMVWDSVGLDG